MSPNLYLPPETRLGPGNMFRSVCQEFCPRGGGLQAHTQAEVGGVWLGVSPGPHPGGRLGDLQAHTGGRLGVWQGGSPGLHLEGDAPGPHLGGGSRPRPQGVYPSMYRGRPHKQMATAVGGMHSCNCKFIFKKRAILSVEEKCV